MARHGKGTIGTSDPIVFLDIDGVLNAHVYDEEAMSNTIDRGMVKLLNRILRETGAKVVLSSAWRYIVHRGEAQLSGMDWLLRSHGLMAGRLLGITAPDTMVPSDDRGGIGNALPFWPLENERGEQIADWRRRHSHRGRYVAIDDGGRDRATGNWSDLGIEAAGHPVVWTDGSIGLTTTDVGRAVGLLRGDFSCT